MVGPERKHLSADALFSMVHTSFAKIPDHRVGRPAISLADALMSAFAMFSLKCPSLLQFDEQQRADDNIRSIYRVGRVPCDTQMRTIIDPVGPETLRPIFRDVFRQVQRGKVLEQFVCLEGCYLLSLDGTGYFSSNKVHCPSCLRRVSGSGEVTWHHQMLGAALVHPDLKEVIPLCPEPIIQQDGHTKNDCERNAARRFLAAFRRDHPHLPVIVVEDGLSSNGPHIRDLVDHRMHFILGVQPGDHRALFEHVGLRESVGAVTHVTIRDQDPKSDRQHLITIVPDVHLNESHPDLRVTFVRYTEWIPSTNPTRTFTWVTDLKVHPGNAWQFMRAGRSRWKIENETFNTLKNQGYHFEHNYGHGQQHLSVNLALLMMLAFLVDQVLQRCNVLFRATWHKVRSKRLFWEEMRSIFFHFRLGSMQELYQTILYGHKKQHPAILNSS